jgi:hypothetical protein
MTSMSIDYQLGVNTINITAIIIVIVEILVIGTLSVRMSVTWRMTVSAVGEGAVTIMNFAQAVMITSPV